MHEELNCVFVEREGDGDVGRWRDDACAQSIDEFLRFARLTWS
jgi:hypothetical protein